LKSISKDLKNYLGYVIIGALVIFAVSGAMYVRGYYKFIEPSSYRSFSVSAEGDAVAVPDVARFTFTVITEGGTDIASLQEENSSKINSALEFVKASGVEDKDIKTSFYNVSPRYEYYKCEDGPCPPPEIVGYTIRQSVSVKVRDFEKTGSLLTEVVDRGANSVSQLSFIVDDPTEVNNEARAEAISKAQEKAKSIAGAAGFKLGRLLSFQEGVQPYYPVYEKAAVSAPAIEPGSQEVTVNVTLTYEIK